MNFKKLIWEDNVTERGKQSGLFYIECRPKVLGLEYTITNTLAGSNVRSEKFYLEVRGEALRTFDTEMEAIEFSQKHFEEKVTDFFFEKDIII